MISPLLTRPAVDPSDLATGPVPAWLRPTGRVPAVLAAWENGALGEAPTGLAWDVVRIPIKAGHETVKQLREARVPLGPVLLTPLGVDFLVALGSADGWDAPDSALLPTGQLVLLPHPCFKKPAHLAWRSWIVPPAGDGTLTAGPDLRDAYQAARANAAEAREVQR